MRMRPIILAPRWTVLALLGAVACTAPRSVGSESTECLAGVETEGCDVDDAGLGVRTICSADGAWTRIETCPAKMVCKIGFDSAGVTRSACVTPSSGSGGTTLPDGGTGTTSQDAGSTGDASPSGASDSGSGAASDASPDSKDASPDGKDASPDSGGTVFVPSAACLQQHCPSQAQQCLPIPSCTQALANLTSCIQTCGGTLACLSNCTGAAGGDTRAYTLVTCGFQACLAGVGGKPAAGSCVGSCGTQSAAGCYCDPACVQQNDCCSDYAKTCTP